MHLLGFNSAVLFAADIVSVDCFQLVQCAYDTWYILSVLLAFLLLMLVLFFTSVNYNLWLTMILVVLGVT